MAAIRVRQFRSVHDLTAAVADLLEDRFTRPFGRPHAVMLSGGSTPLAAYEEVAGRSRWAVDDLYVFLSDERMVPVDSPDSNYGRARTMLDRIQVAENRVMRVDTALPLKRAAADYDRALRQFVRSGGRITLGLLGLGADGHTASLFSPDDLARGAGAFAVAVPSTAGFARVSVTPDLLKRVEALIFLVVGPDKQDAVSRLLKAPDTLVAGRAVRDAPAVQLWTA